MADCIECGRQLSSADEIAGRDRCDNCYRGSREHQKQQALEVEHMALRQEYIVLKGGKL